MAASGHGDSWAPLNGNSPWWANFLVWLVKNGVLFQVFFVIAGSVVLAVIIGKIDSPMLDAFKNIGNVLEAQQTTLKEIKDEAVKTRGINERIETYMAVTAKEIRKH